jgi:hypothetical protein
MKIIYVLALAPPIPQHLSTPDVAERGVNSHILFFRFG